MSKKQFLWNVVSAIAVLILTILIFDYQSNENDLKADIEKWKKIAESEQEVPNINKEANNFLKALTSASHSKYLTDQALKEYQSEIEEHEEEEHNHADVGEQTIDILNTTTEKVNQDEATSVILYQVLYKSPFDSEESGIIDQRILTLVLNIDWKKEDDIFKVDKYNMNLLQDNLDDYLFELSQKGDENE